MNESGCSRKDELQGLHQDTLDICKDFCKEFKYLQYHGLTDIGRHCGCYSVCDFKRPASDYHGKADVFERLDAMISI